MECVKVRYNDNCDQWLMTPAIDLRATRGASLNYSLWYEIEYWYDSGYVEISTDGGSTWTELKSYTGSGGTWTEESIDISAYTGYSDVRVRFRLGSDCSVTYAGLYIDDVRVGGVGVDWLNVTPLKGTVEPGNSDDITVTINATDLDVGEYSASIIIDHNDLRKSSIVILVNLVVSPPEPTVISFSPDDTTPTQYVNETYTFDVITDQIMTSNEWYLQPLPEGAGAGYTAEYISSWTTTWRSVGIYNVTYVGSNLNGSVSQTWIVTVVE
jgi:hypothetical protein